MISFALILMTLPSRLAEVRARRADRARHGESSTGPADRAGLADLSLQGRCSGVCVKRRSSNNRRLAQAPLQPETAATTTKEP